MRLFRLYMMMSAIALCATAWGQTDVLLSQQQFSKINYNPAATGFSNYAHAYLFARQQWIGIEGAPSTQQFSAHGFFEKIRSGVGLFVQNDKIGRNKTFELMLAYAYHVRVGYEKYFSFGLSAGVLNKKMGGDVVVIDPELDPDLINMMINGESRLRPNVDFGVTFVTPKLSIGLSATHISRYLYQDEDWFKVPMHVYGFAEYGIDLGKNLRFTPHVQISGVFSGYKYENDTLALADKFSWQYQAGGIFSVKDVFWIGATYRNGDAIVGMIGINFTPNLRFGYSYDMRLGNTFQNIKTFGSHEIMLNYRLKMTGVENADLTPRFFD